jgi:hypothetical protein
VGVDVDVDARILIKGAIDNEFVIKIAFQSHKRIKE